MVWNNSTVAVLNVEPGVLNKVIKDKCEQMKPLIRLR